MATFKVVKASEVAADLDTNKESRMLPFKKEVLDEAIALKKVGDAIVVPLPAKTEEWTNKPLSERGNALRVIFINSLKTMFNTHKSAKSLKFAIKPLKGNQVLIEKKA